MAIRGNTVINITPRDEGNGFALYQRDALKAPTAEVVKVQRYIAPKLVNVLPQ